MSPLNWGNREVFSFESGRVLVCMKDNVTHYLLVTDGGGGRIFDDFVKKFVLHLKFERTN